MTQRAGQTLRGLRLERGRTLEAVSVMSRPPGAKKGLDIGAISRIERGLTEPEASTVVRLAKAFGISAFRMQEIIDAGRKAVA